MGKSIPPQKVSPSDDRFWKVIEMARIVAEDDIEQQVAAMAGHLTTWPESEIVNYGSWINTKILEANTYALLLAV
jgi:hypothetical protein